MTIAVALASYRFVEQPIRRGAFPARTLRWLTPVAAGALIVTMVVATLGYRSPDAPGEAGITDAHVAARVARRHPDATRLLVVGNSVAYYLGGEGFSRLHTRPPIVTLNGGLPACIFPATERMRFQAYGAGIRTGACDRDWRAAARIFRPDLALLTFSDTGPGQMRHDGRWVSPCDRSYRPWYLRTLGRRVRELRAVGARVVLTTSAYSVGFGATEANRIESDCTNVLIREFAQQHPGVVIVDLERFVCPTERGDCRTTLAGATLRPDGVHYRKRSARLVARWILDQVPASPRVATD